MKKNIEIIYSVVDVAAISTKSTLLTADKSAKTSSKLSKEEGQLWNNVVVLSAPVILQAAKLQVNDKAAAYEALTSNMEQLIQADTVLPEFIQNKKGEQVPLSKANGDVKWSTWGKTQRIWDYLSAISKVLACGLAGELYPETGKVAARCSILAACSGTESPIEGVRRYAKGLQGSLSLIEVPTEVLEAHSLVSALAVPKMDPLVEALALVAKLDAFLAVCPSQKQKDQVLVAMDKLAKHFPNA